MYSVFEHIKQKYNEPIFDEVKYITGTGKINLTYDQQGICAILYHYLYWVPTGSNATFTFLDQFNQPLFTTFDAAAGIPTWTPLPLVRPGNILLITCSLNTIMFSVSYQKLFLRSKHQDK